jgi:hypothetical protein
MLMTSITILTLLCAPLLAPQAQTGPTSAPAKVNSNDAEPPIIEDVAVATSPGVAPVVSATMSDSGSGVGEARVYYRTAGATEWAHAAFSGSADSSLFLARLPAGLEASGFSYYIEATDKSGNGPVRIGSPTTPIDVARAEESMRARFDRQELEPVREETSGARPALIMLGFGVGVLSAAGAAAYLGDLVVSNERLDEVNRQLAGDPSDAQRAQLRDERKGYQDALVTDGAIASILGVVAVTGLVTGTALLIAANLE